MKKHLLLFFFYLFRFTDLFCYEKQLAIATVFQNEARFLKEWIDYHRVAGVEHFYLYNNSSTDHYQEVLQPYIDRGIVELFYWPSWKTENYRSHFDLEVMPGAFFDAVLRARKAGIKWLALIDSDEFIVPKEGWNIATVLNKYFDDEVGVVVYWQKFGTNHVDFVSDEEYMIEKLTAKAVPNDPVNIFYKSIVRPKKCRKVDNPHNSKYYDGKKAVNTLGQRQDAFTTQRLQINHYWTRDNQFMIDVKWPRYNKFTGQVLENFLSSFEYLNAVQDTEILRFVPWMKQARAIGY